MSKNSQIVEIKSLITTIALDIVIVERQSDKSDNVIRTELADSQSYLKNYKTQLNLNFLNSTPNLRKSWFRESTSTGLIELLVRNVN